MYFNLRTVLSLGANGNPLQCSCLENPRDGGAWWAAVYGVAQSWTGLKWLRSSSSNAQTVQCLTHGNASIRLYVNNYNCNKSCLGNLFLKTCTPDDTATVYLTQRHCRIHSPWLILCQNDFRMYVLGKGLGNSYNFEVFFFYLFSTVSWEVYKALLKLVASEDTCFWRLCQKTFLSFYTLINFATRCSEWLSLCLLVPEWNYLLGDQESVHCCIITYQYLQFSRRDL